MEMECAFAVSERITVDDGVYVLVHSRSDVNGRDGMRAGRKTLRLGVEKELMI